MHKKPLSFWQMFNLNFGFLGIQFGWALQMANMSGIYKFLGATEADIGYLWIAAPVSGMLIQPFLGLLSDSTWIRWLGRRRPYILGGAITASLALILMPNSTDLWMAASLLWVLDGSVNIAMQPYRALVADVSPDCQHTICYAIQSCLVGIGSTLASAFPWLLLNVFHFSAESAPGTIPTVIKVSFYLGATVFMFCNIWTVFTSKEYPPEDLEQWNQNKEKHSFWGTLYKFNIIASDFIQMPKTMREMSFVQFFSWLGMFCVFLYFGLGVAQNIFGLPPGVSVTEHPELRSLLAHGVALGGLSFATYNLFSIIFALLLPSIAKLITRKGTHIVSLTIGGICLIACNYVHSKELLLVFMAGFGIAAASLITIPYAILAGNLPEEKMGLYMGLFNITICVPQIIAALSLGVIVTYIFHNHAMPIIEMAGVFFLIAAGLTFFVHDTDTQQV